MEKKVWEKPEMEIVEIDIEDVIETSGGGYTSSTTNATACN